MPSKPTKCSLKFWVLANAQSYYISYASMYIGRTKQLIVDHTV